MIDKPKIVELVNNIIKEVAIELGFSDSYQRRNLNFGFDQITSSQIGVRQLDGSFRVVLSLTRRIDQIENLWEDFGDKINVQNHDNVTFNLTALQCYPELINEPYCHEGTGWLKFRANSAGYKEFKEVAKLLYKEKVIPKAEEYLDLRRLDAEINSKIEIEEDLTNYIFSANGLIFRRIGLAKKSKNPLFERICEYHRSFFEEYIELSQAPGLEYFKNIPTVFENVYERLVNK